MPRTERLFPTPEGLARAAHLLREGRTVAFPTETVYGLGANALEPAAIARIFDAKQRPAWDPIIVHIASLEALPAFATASPQALTLAQHFWPGPLTILLPRTQAIPDAVTAGRPLVGVRIPAHPVALDLLRLTGLPIAAPSANRFGHTSPTTAQHVFDDLDGRIDAVLDAGPTAVGLESTVLDPNSLPMTIYRSGAVTAAMIEALTGPNSVVHYQPSLQTTPPESLPSPGVGIRHYAPRARLVLFDAPSPEPAFYVPLIAEAASQSPSLMLPLGWPAPPATLTYPWGDWNNPAILAHNLFAGLRHLDQSGADLILCPTPHGSGLATALRDRLEKAGHRG